MTYVLAQVAAWLSAAANVLGRFLLAPVGVVPGWLSATVVAAVTGVLLLAVFKYTSNQGAIKRVRNDINAHLLALKLFKDSARVSLRAQGRILRGAFRLFVLAIVPMLVMVVPVTLLLGQLALWYQARPLGSARTPSSRSSSTAMPASAWPAVSLQPTDAVEVDGRARSACGASARSAGTSRPASPAATGWCSRSATRPIAKELAIGDGFMRVSTRAAGLGLVGHPAEPLGGAVPARRPGPVDRDRLPAALFVDQRHRLVGHLLVRRLDGRRPVLPPGV